MTPRPPRHSAPSLRKKLQSHSHAPGNPARTAGSPAGHLRGARQQRTKKRRISSRLSRPLAREPTVFLGGDKPLNSRKGCITMAARPTMTHDKLLDKLPRRLGIYRCLRCHQQAVTPQCPNLAAAGEKSVCPTPPFTCHKNTSVRGGGRRKCQNQ